MELVQNPESAWKRPTGLSEAGGTDLRQTFGAYFAADARFDEDCTYFTSYDHATQWLPAALIIVIAMWTAHVVFRRATSFARELSAASGRALGESSRETVESLRSAAGSITSRAGSHSACRYMRHGDGDGVARE